MNNRQFSFSTAKILCIREQNSRANTYTISLDEPVEIRHGQFIMISAPKNGEIVAMANPIAQDGQICEFTIVNSDRFSLDFMENVRIHSEILVRGGYGSPFDISELQKKDTTIITYGLKFADIRPYLSLLLGSRIGMIDILLSAYDQSELLYADEYSHWQALENAQLTISLQYPDNSWSGHRGDVLSLIKQNKNMLRERNILIALPEKYLNRTLNFLIETNTAPGDIYIVFKNGVNCGIGKCGGCNIGPYRICKDGPTMNYADIYKYMKLRKYEHKLTEVYG